MRRSIAAAAALLTAAVVAAPAAAQGPAPSPADALATADPLRPGDVVRVRIWREPELSGEFPVDSDGMVVFPKLGPMHVTSFSAVTLRERLVRDYGEFLNHGSIELTLLRRLQVLGAVRNPGLYPVDGTMTVTDVLALAGGATPQGNPRRVVLIRNGERVTSGLDVHTPLGRSPMRSGDQLFIPERSWISRNTGVLAAVLSTGATVFVALLTR